MPDQNTAVRFEGKIIPNQDKLIRLLVLSRGTNARTGSVNLLATNLHVDLHKESRQTVRARHAARKEHGIFVRDDRF